MFRKKRLQVVDLGAHVIKALVLEPGPDGRLALIAAEARPLPDPIADPDLHLAEVERVIAQLAGGVLARHEPVHLLAGEALVRTQITSLTGVPEDALPDVVLTDRARFLRTWSTRQRAFASSVRLKLARAGETVDVTLAHAYARWVDLEHLHHQLRAHGLQLGAVLPRALALRELVRRVAPSTSGAAVVAEVGFTTTSLMRLGDGEPRRWKVVFAGGADLFRDVAGQLQREQPLDGATFLAVMTRVGFTGDERRLADAGLTEMEVRGVARALRDRAAALFSAIARGCDALFAEPRADEDRQIELEDTGTGPSVPVPGTPPAYRVLLTGGIALVPGFLEAARTHLGGTASLISVEGAIDPGPRTPQAPLELFAACAGAARLLSTPDAVTGDVAREYVELVAAHDAAAQRWSPLNPRFLRALAISMVVLVVTTALWTQNLSSRVDELTASIATERASLESAASMKDLLARFRDVRVKEALADTRVRYVQHLLSRRPDWPALVNRLGALTSPRSLAITELTFDVHWPRANGAQPTRSSRETPADGESEVRRPAADGKWLEIRLAGEADSLDTLRKFVADLETKKVLSDLNYDSSARMPEGKAHGLEHHAHFAFTVNGNGDLSTDAKP